MKLDFVKLSPTQNTTILVTSPVERSIQPSIAEKLMAHDSVQGEQVAFLEKASLNGARARLQMMGGEFCGNASMSMAAFFAMQDGLSDGATAVYPLEVSGAEGMVNCRIQRQGAAYLGTVLMPLPEEIRMLRFSDGFCCPVVFFAGIAHAVVDAEKMRRAEAEACIARWCEESRQDAFGILLTQNDAIEPLVYVRQTASAVWERGCGSGSAALGAYRAWQKQGDVSFSICQPGGDILVDVAYERQICKITITGRVKIAAMGQAWID